MKRKDNRRRIEGKWQDTDVRDSFRKREKAIEDYRSNRVRKTKSVDFGSNKDPLIQYSLQPKPPTRSLNAHGTNHTSLQHRTKPRPASSPVPRLQPDCHPSSRGPNYWPRTQISPITQSTQPNGWSPQPAPRLKVACTCIDPDCAIWHTCSVTPLRLSLLDSTSRLRIGPSWLDKEKSAIFIVLSVSKLNLTLFKASKVRIRVKL